jgi:hypothetical protein
MKKPTYVYKFKGQWKGLAEWAREYGIPYNALYIRVERQGWSMRDALLKPFRAWARNQ